MKFLSIFLNSAFLVLFTTLSIHGADQSGITDPSIAGPDFQLQGEYLGELIHDSKIKTFGAQVISKGDGKFVIKLMAGGLPGQEGFLKEEKPILLTALTENGKTNVQGKDYSGYIEKEKLTIINKEKKSHTLNKVERKSPTLGKSPPSNSIILFDGKNAGEWNNGKLVENELLNNGVSSKKKFKDFHLHLEFRLPFMPKASGQGRGNSGLYLQDRYEIQILDSFGLDGKNNECGGVYTQYAPSVNACLPPLVWQTYDVDFKAAKYDENGKKISDAEATVFHNGIKIHENIKLKGPTGGGKPETKEPGSFQLQNHGNPVYFRNIWVIEK